MVKIAPILYCIMQIFTLSVFQEVDDQLFGHNIETYYLYLIIMLTLIFYGFTSFKDPGYVTINDYQYTDSSNPYQKKRPSFNPFHGNSQIRTKEHVQDEQIELKDQKQPKQHPKNKDQFEMDCEASIDEQNFPDHDVNHIDIQTKSFEKTPEKSKSASKVISQSQSPHPNNARTSQVLSQDSTKPDNNNNNNPPTEPQFQFQQEINIQQVIEHQQSPKSAHNEKNIDQSVHHGNSMFIEKRYCPLCNQDQIIRSKHCRRCNRCVALYDHHCPWVFFKSISKDQQLCWRTKQMCFLLVFIFLALRNHICNERMKAFPHIDFTQYSSSFSAMVIFALILSIMMGLMVLSLFLFHSLMSCRNITTWEYKSWKRISYLKDFPQGLGSPFNQGWKKNLKQYCRFSVPKLTNWEYNTQIHPYEDIEATLLAQCELVEKITQNISSINSDMVQFSKIPMDQWQIERLSYQTQISSLKSQIETQEKDHVQEINLLEQKFQQMKQNLQNESLTQLQLKENQIVKLQQEIKLLIKQKEELQQQTQTQIRKLSNDQTQLTQKLQNEKEISKLREENKQLKTQLQVLQDQNAKLEEQNLKKSSQLQEQLNQKQKELNQVKELAQVILDQRTQIEDFFMESLQKCELGDDLQIKSIPQQMKIQILKDIINAFTKSKKKQ